MTLPQILGSITIALIWFITLIYLATKLEKYARRKWMKAEPHQIMVASAVMIALFGTLLLAAIIRIGLLIGGII